MDCTRSADTHREQHLAFGDGLDRVRHIGLQYKRLAATEPVLRSACRHGQFTPKAVNDHVAGGTMFWKVTAWLECEQQEPESSPMNQPLLPMPTPGWVSLGAQGAGEIRKVESNHGSREPGARMRPQPLVWLIHVCPQKSSNQDAPADCGDHRQCTVLDGP